MARRKRAHVAQSTYEKYVGQDSRRYMPNGDSDREARLYRFYVKRLTELCVSRFKWTGLPPSIDPVFLEQELFYRTVAAFFYDPRYNSFLAMRATPVGQYNLYNNATQFRVFGVNYPTTLISTRYLVPIWSNIEHTPDIDIVLIYAQKFAELDRTIEINSRNARRSKVVAASKNQRLTMTNISENISGGADVVYVEDSIDGNPVDNITALDLGIDVDSLEKLHILKNRLWNECMMYLGIDGANQDKKERLVSNEVKANAEQVNLAKVVNLKTRKLAAERINRRFGHMLSETVTVDYDSLIAPGFNTTIGSGE